MSFRPANVRHAGSEGDVRDSPNTMRLLGADLEWQRRRSQSTSGSTGPNGIYSSDIELIESHKSNTPPTTRESATAEITAVFNGVSPKQTEEAVRDALQIEGWRFGASAAAITATITMIINFSFGIYSSTLIGQDSEASSGILVELFHGSCDTAATMNTWSHLAINVVGTGLLAGSNYCMQCLVAPTRAELDAVHAKFPPDWLDIGLPSFRNLASIDERRARLWWLLLLSSLPLHLM